ncbi:MAG: UbiA family prenyltransferase [Synergistaceae bacterium]|nr:UbiA family prenyltransferase [Synergistaceae bacterium]
MIKRLNLYLKEMLPPLKCFLASSVLFFEIYFLIILIANEPSFHIGIQEITGCITIFTFLLSLRIADDFKDYKTDLKLFPDRPLPSGRVLKKDLATLLICVNVIAIALNVVFMNNLAYYVLLIAYGTLMSVWFFARSKIQKNLFLALVTHNPVDIIINIYIISFTCIKYGLAIFTFTNVLIALTLYWPTLIWEISRKIRAPDDETEYTTYSKLYGYKKITIIILFIITIDLITSAKLMYDLWAWGNIAVVAAWIWFVWQALAFIKNPKRFKLVSRIEIYEIITEIPVIAVQAGIILARGMI